MTGAPARPRERAVEAESLTPAPRRPSHDEQPSVTLVRGSGPPPSQPRLNGQGHPSEVFMTFGQSTITALGILPLPVLAESQILVPR